MRRCSFPSPLAFPLAPQYPPLSGSPLLRLWDVISSWYYGFKYFKSEIYEKKGLRVSWVTELLVLFFYHIDKNVHIICTHYAKRHETNDKRWIRDVIWSWHKILKRQENDNTKRKTLYDLKLFKKFLTSGNERREIPAADLQHLVRDKVCAQSEK